MRNSKSEEEEEERECVGEDGRVFDLVLSIFFPIDLMIIRSQGTRFLVIIGDYLIMLKREMDGHG